MLPAPESPWGVSAPPWSRSRARKREEAPGKRSVLRDFKNRWARQSAGLQEGHARDHDGLGNAAEKSGPFHPVLVAACRHLQSLLKVTATLVASDDTRLSSSGPAACESDPGLPGHGRGPSGALSPETQAL